MPWKMIDPLNEDLPDFDEEDDALAPEDIERQELETAMKWIGYTPDQQAAALADKLGSLPDFASFTTIADIKNMVKDGATYRETFLPLKPDDLSRTVPF